MNKARKFSWIVLSAALVFGSAAVSAQSATATPPKSATKSAAKPAAKPAAATTAAPSGSSAASKPTSTTSDEFFVVSSVEKVNNQYNLVLLRVTETTATMLVTDKTQIVDETGKPLKVTDLRAGDTLFVSYSSGAGGALTATHVRKGIMTLAELRSRYEPALPATRQAAAPGTAGH
jgi:hypothetical protein